MFFINCWFTNASGLSILMAKITWTTEITNENVKNMFSNHICNSRYLVFSLCFDFLPLLDSLAVLKTLIELGWAWSKDWIEILTQQTKKYFHISEWLVSPDILVYWDLPLLARSFTRWKEKHVGGEIPPRTILCYFKKKIKCFNFGYVWVFLEFEEKVSVA